MLMSLGYMSSFMSVISSPPSLFVFSACAYGGVVGYFFVFSFLCEFCFLYCDDVWLGVAYEVF